MTHFVSILYKLFLNSSLLSLTVLAANEKTYGKRNKISLLLPLSSCYLKLHLVSGGGGRIFVLRVTQRKRGLVKNVTERSDGGWLVQKMVTLA